MNDFAELLEFVLARIAENKAAAEMAIDPERPGTHWQWVTDENDTVIAPGDLQEAQSYQTVSLRTVEEFPSHVGPLPGFIVSGTSEVHSGGGEHIVRWDPARVLADCKVKRRIVTDIAVVVLESFGVQWPDGYKEALEHIIRVSATLDADHPDYREEWKP